jgi:hypothetical protein
MRTVLAGGAAIVAAGGLVALATTSIADEGGAARAPAADPEVERVAVERVSPRLAQRGSARKAQALTYFEVPTPLEVPPKTEVTVELSKCPKGSKAVTGYFHPENPGTFLDRSRPVLSTARMWAIGAFNTTDVPDRVTFGLVCLSKVK